MSHHLIRMEKRGLIERIARDAQYPEIGTSEQGWRWFGPVHRRTRR
ncbi:hypothetical protein [Kribbella italica]|uniref:ArsR family transcriptional regulator n=1 Tax=Kribbella italica TaxID=1540520 RepID=A0A7W9JGX6_9ACTN|nr:hypothetical protein [Kribbella italica]MBB5841630.1 hypothetical protein [Kribbella italica]